MKKSLLIAALMAAAPAAFAQGYVGAVLAMTRLNDACATSLRCQDTNATGFKVFGGAYLPPHQTLSLGAAKVNRVEVAAMRFGKVTSSGTVAGKIFDGDADAYFTQPVASTLKVQADAILAAAAMEVPLAKQLNLTTKLGLAYVSATAGVERAGRRFNSTTQSSVQPYAGLGLEYNAYGSVLLQGAVDWTRYRVEGYSGSAMQVGLGASVAF